LLLSELGDFMEVELADLLYGLEDCLLRNLLETLVNMDGLLLFLVFALSFEGLLQDFGGGRGVWGVAGVEVINAGGQVVDKNFLAYVTLAALSHVDRVRVVHELVVLLLLLLFVLARELLMEWPALRVEVLHVLLDSHVDHVYVEVRVRDELAFRIAVLVAPCYRNYLFHLILLALPHVTFRRRNVVPSIKHLLLLHVLLDVSVLLLSVRCFRPSRRHNMV